MMIPELGQALAAHDPVGCPRAGGVQGQGEGPWPGHDLSCFRWPQGTVGAGLQPKIKQTQP